jgi:hypothetical protein
MTRIFVAQERLDAWYLAGTVGVEGDRVSFPGGADGRLEPAVCFVRLDAGEPPGEAHGEQRDPHALLGRAKTEQQLRAMGTRPYGNSVVLGEVAYEVVLGFAIEVSTATAASAEGVVSAAERLTVLRHWLLDATRQT